jgi:aldose 1-epimerase
MPFRVRTESRPNAFDRDPTVTIAEDDAGNRLEVWPALGFNAYHWSAAGTEILFCDPDFFRVLKPSRTGVPILFPFPNRIRDGKYSWNGTSYSLPKNDGTKKNAIHGSALYAAWQPKPPRIVGDVVELSATFHGETMKDGAPFWPTPQTLTVTYRLGRGFLDIVAEVTAGAEPVPMGLGYHPYFRLEPFGGADARPWIAATKMWKLDESLPTGELVVPTGDLDYGTPKPIAARTPDDVYTAIDPRGVRGDLRLVAGITSKSGQKRFEMWTSPEYREIVVFVPAHRQAIAIEPYTCTTDAINLQARGVDAGWFAVPAGGTWRGTVHLEYHG